MTHDLIFGALCWLAASIVAGLCIGRFIRQGGLKPAPRRDPFDVPRPGSLGSSPWTELDEAERRGR